MSTATAIRPRPVTHAIRNGKEFEEVVAELDTLIDADPKEGTVLYDRMELLTILVEAYEQKNLPELKPASPQEMVRFMAQQKGLDNVALAHLLGGKSRLSEFYRGVRELSRNQITAL